MAWLGLMFLRILGWRVEGEIPPIKKFVMIAAPHTSNWDFPITLAVAFVLKIKIYWMGKAAMFRWPFGASLRWLGGIPIDRGQSHNVVEQSIQAFKNWEKLILVVPPEGTRRKVHYWKTGFYHIAVGAQVPIVMAYMDYQKKISGLGPLMQPSGDIEADMLKIKAFYAPFKGKNADQFQAE